MATTGSSENRPRATIFVQGVELDVEAHANLLDAISASHGGALDRGNYCREGECAHCEVSITRADGGRRVVMACRQVVTNGLEITALSRYIEKDLER
jgi:hypothetical protein